MDRYPHYSSRHVYPTPAAGLCRRNARHPSTSPRQPGQSKSRCSAGGPSKKHTRNHDEVLLVSWQYVDEVSESQNSKRRTSRLYYIPDEAETVQTPRSSGEPCPPLRHRQCPLCTQ
ncbi:hypothetical protein J6590_083475 [Homalodisca vitripennis]|nr:hypothetical protein J6590_083475 [Homalodisca vitripennis]